MANRQDDHAPLDDFFSGYDRDEKDAPTEKADKAKALDSHIQPSTRSGILSLFGTRKPAARKGHNVAMQPEALEVRQVLTTTTNPLTEAWQNAPGAPADAIGNLNPYPNAFMYDINISPDGTRLATAGSNKEIHIINVQSGQIEQTLRGHSSLVMEVDFSPDGTKLVSASYDKTARIWDVQTGALLQTINLPQLGLRVDWSPRGDMVAIGVHVNVTQLYNVATGAVTSVSYPGNTEAVIFDFTEDGNHILHTNGTNVTMHDTATGALVKTFTGVNQPIYSVDVDPTGTYVAAGTLNGKVLVWDMATGVLKSDQSIHVGGSVKSVQFMTGGSPHLVSADYTNKIIVQNIEGLASGNPLVEVKRYIVPNPDSIVASHTGGEFFVRTGDNTGATYITAYDAPDPPEPPAPEPEPEPELPVYGPEEPEEVSASSEMLLTEYIAQTMDDLRASIETDSAILPELQRRNTERERELAVLETAITPARASVAAAEAYVQLIEAEISTLNAQYAAAIQSGDSAAEYEARRGIDKKIPIRAHAYAALAVEQNALQALLDQKSAITTAITETAAMIDSTYDRLRTQSQEYMTWASLNGDSEAAALVAAEGFISTGLQHGYNTMSHVQMSVNILDKQMGSSDIAAHFLPQNITEIQEHASPVLTKSGGLLKIFGRVMNTGNRAGEITVHIGGTSDRYPNMPDQYTISVYLNPGEYRDFVSTVLIPAGESSTGSLRLRATTPDEEAVLQEIRNREPGVESEEERLTKEERNEKTVLHNARVIAMTEGLNTLGQITLDPTDRLKNYLAANASEAGSIARKIENGEIARDEFAEKFLVAESASRTIASAIMREVLSEQVEDIQLTDEEREYLATHIVLLNADISSMNLSNFLQSLSFIRIRRELESTPQSEIYSQVSSWYTDTTHNSYPEIVNTTVRDDTAAGRIFLGLYKEAFNGTDMEIKKRFVMAEKVIGIKAEQLWAAARERDYKKFFYELAAQYEQRGLRHIFFRKGDAETENYVLNVQTNGTEYFDADKFVRVYFDFSGPENEFHHANLYLTTEAGILIPTPLVKDIKGKLFVDVPLSEFNIANRGEMISGNFRIKVAVWKSGEPESPGLSGKYLSDPFYIYYEGRTVVETNGMTDKNGNPLDAAQEQFIRSILDFDDINYPEGSANKKIIDYLLKNYFSSSAQDRLRYESDTELKGLLHGAGMQCKEWARQIILNATDNAVNIPSTNENDDSIWNIGDRNDIEEIAPHDERSENASFSSIIKAYAKPGDAIQMTGSFGDSNLHTLIIGKIADDGVWVFDSNWGPKETLVDENGNEIKIADNTVRYRFVEFSLINNKIDQFSLYRIQL